MKYRERKKSLCSDFYTEDYCNDGSRNREEDKRNQTEVKTDCLYVKSKRRLLIVF